VQPARDAYLDALYAVLFAGRLTIGPEGLQMAEALRMPRFPAEPGKEDALLEGLAVLFADGYGPAAPLLQQAALGGSCGSSCRTSRPYPPSGGAVAVG